MQSRPIATEQDVEAATVLPHRTNWGKRVADPVVFKELVARSQLALVAEIDGQVVGFLRALTDGILSGCIPMVVVAGERRGQGIGSALVRTAMGEKPEITGVLRAGRDGVSAFYEKLGFKPYEVAMERPGQPS